jgi:CubicO group peptidase (beta-lactamase class C family)
LSAQAVRALLEEGVDRGFFAGAAASVSGEDGVLAEVYVGQAVAEPESEKRDAGVETLWDLASLTKPIAGAALALSLVEDRAFGLDDSLSRFHDVYKKTRFDGVTIRSLMNHTAGQASWYPCYVHGEGRDAFRRTLSAVDAAGPPGVVVLYSCLGFLLLADAVEVACQGPLDAFFDRRVAGPLGLEKDLKFGPLNREDLDRSTGGERDDATERAMVDARKLRYTGFRTGFVNGEVNDGNAYRRAGGVSLNAGLFGTARAVSAIGRAWLTRDPRLLRESSIEMAVSDSTGGLAEPRGLGWQLATALNGAGPSFSEGSYGHIGFTGTSLFVDPGKKHVFALLANCLHPDARTVDMNEFRRRFHAIASRID